MTGAAPTELDAALQAFPVVELYDCLKDVVYFVKDRAGRYVQMNDTLVERCGFQEKSDLVGKTPTELMGAKLGKSYEAQDRDVAETGKPVTDQLELHFYANQRVGWCVTNKRALKDPAGQVCGIIGLSQDLREPDMSHDDFAKLSDVIEYVQTHLEHAPSVEDLARRSGLSSFQLDLRIRRTFGLTAGQWVLKQRLDYAKQALLGTDQSLTDIALASGYSDQSTFTRQFRKTTGLTPLQLRKARGAAADRT